MLNVLIERAYLVTLVMKVWRHFNQRQVVDAYDSYTTQDFCLCLPQTLEEKKKSTYEGMNWGPCYREERGNSGLLAKPLLHSLPPSVFQIVLLKSPRRKK